MHQRENSMACFCVAELSEREDRVHLKVRICCGCLLGLALHARVQLEDVEVDVLLTGLDH